MGGAFIGRGINDPGGGSIPSNAGVTRQCRSEAKEQEEEEDEESEQQEQDNNNEGDRVKLSSEVDLIIHLFKGWEYFLTENPRQQQYLLATSLSSYPLANTANS